MRCMIIDDNTEHLDISSHLVEQLGHQAMAYSSAEDALLVCKRVLPDIVLLDWKMKGMDGPTFLEKFKRLQEEASHLTEEIPVVMCTGISDKQRVMEMLTAGVKGYIIKPFGKKDLEQQLAKFKLSA